MNLITIKQSVTGELTTTSRNVAEVFGKRHDDILKKISNTIPELSPEFGARNFAESSYINEQNKKQKEYILTRDGWAFTIMGFTGKKAAKFKEQYITKFSEMENSIRNRPKLDIDSIISKLTSYIDKKFDSLTPTTLKTTDTPLLNSRISRAVIRSLVNKKSSELSEGKGAIYHMCYKILETKLGINLKQEAYKLGCNRLKTIEALGHLHTLHSILISI